MSAGVIDTTLSNELRELERVADLVDDFGARHGLAPSVLQDVQVCLDEILSNIVRHAFTDDARHTIAVRVALEGSQVVIEVTDDGRPFDPRMYESAEPRGGLERPIGGLGIYFLKRLMDELSYQREGALNRLVAKKNVLAAR